MDRGLMKDGVEALYAALARHVERGDMPGLVALVACGDDVHVEAIGHRDFGDAEPIGRDTIFRIASARMGPLVTIFVLNVTEQPATNTTIPRYSAMAVGEAREADTGAADRTGAAAHEPSK